jgi:hypothetical protein
MGDRQYLVSAVLSFLSREMAYVFHFTPWSRTLRLTRGRARRVEPVVSGPSRDLAPLPVHKTASQVPSNISEIIAYKMLMRP